MRKSLTRAAAVIALAYAALAGVWALLVHLFLGSFMVDPHNYLRTDLPADSALAAVTTLILFALLRRELARREKANEALRRSHDELEVRVRQRTQALNAERDKLFRILDIMPEGICIINEQFELEYANSVLEKQWGPIEGRTCTTYFNDLDEPCPVCKPSEVFARPNHSLEWYSAKKGRTYEIFAIPLQDPDDRPIALEIFRDVTERRAAEREQAHLLRQIDSERRLSQAVIRNAPASIALFDGLEFRLKWANPQYQRAFGQSFQGADMTGLDVLTLFPGASRNGMLDAFRQVSTTGEPFSEAELPFWEPGRGLAYWQWSLLPLSVDEQAAPDLMLMAHDVTEQVEARKRLEEMSADAERRADELRQAHADLEVRAKELVTMLDISHNIASTMLTLPLLDVLLDQLKIMIDYTAAAVFTLQNDDVEVVAYRGPLRQDETLGIRASLKETPGLEQILECREPVIIDDLESDVALARRMMATAAPEMRKILGNSRSWMGIPLMIKDRVIGLLRFDQLQPAYFTPHHAQIALTIANQAAIAMENARLYEEAGKVATLEERQCLARELHDSVSQALYGIALGAHAAREQLVRAPARVKDTLDYMLALADTAVSEMRALIFELRPDSLNQEGLVFALSRLAETLRARDRASIRLDLRLEPALSLDAKEVLYRIAQEALRNTIKHAHAKTIGVTLYQDNEWMCLEVEDDGSGFDPSGQFPGHLGLQSMRERTNRLGGVLEIESTLDVGTWVCVRIPVEQPTT